ncbi:hypothetical protein [Nostoc sp. DedSLP04]|nr:hypothetical protein [Nostoc sp. DedSLP04]MDZ8033277.1 hypothetical protein [Nostoc sp. DedSLP04]
MTNTSLRTLTACQRQRLRQRLTSAPLPRLRPAQVGTSRSVQVTNDQ